MRMTATANRMCCHQSARLTHLHRDALVAGLLGHKQLALLASKGGLAGGSGRLLQANQQWHNNTLSTGMAEARLLQASKLHTAPNKPTCACQAHQVGLQAIPPPLGSSGAHLLGFLADRRRLGVNLDSSVSSTGITDALCQHGVNLSLQAQSHTTK
jgi:hypothetical protein